MKNNDLLDDFDLCSERLKTIKDVLGFNHKEFAEFLGMSIQGLYCWYKGIPCLSARNIIDLIKIGINPLYIYGYGEITLNGTTVDTVRENAK